MDIQEVKTNGTKRGELSFKSSTGKRWFYVFYTLNRRIHAVANIDNTESVRPITRKSLIDQLSPEAIKRNDVRVSADLKTWLKLAPNVPTGAAEPQAPKTPAKPKAKTAKPAPKVKTIKPTPAPKPAQPTHNWTDKQLAFLIDSDDLQGGTIRDAYNRYRSRFGQHAATFNQFRTRRYVLLNPEVGRARARRYREALRAA